jgi:hypothetical protein
MAGAFVTPRYRLSARMAEPYLTARALADFAACVEGRHVRRASCLRRYALDLGAHGLVWFAVAGGAC